MFAMKAVGIVSKIVLCLFIFTFVKFKPTSTTYLIPSFKTMAAILSVDGAWVDCVAFPLRLFLETGALRSVVLHKTMLPAIGAARSPFCFGGSSGRWG